MIKPLRLWTCFWGQKFEDLFEKALVRSLMWPLNRAAVQGATWDISTKRSDFASVVDIAKSVGIKIELHEIPESLTGDEPMMGSVLLQIFLPAIQRCLETNSQMLIAPPDTIFGGDTIYNLLKIGQAKDSVVFVPHIRVVDTIFSEMDKALAGNQFGPCSSLSNAKLVTVAMRCAHKSWSEAEFGGDRINTHVGGIFWRRLTPELYSVQHMLPTPYLINWTEADYKYFAAPPQPGQHAIVFGDIDHTWPAHCIHPYQRSRLVCSSDAAFMVELTDAEKNIPPLQNYDKSDPDHFWRNAMHNQINRQQIVIFRGE